MRALVGISSIGDSDLGNLTEISLLRNRVRFDRLGKYTTLEVYLLPFRVLRGDTSWR